MENKTLALMIKIQNDSDLSKKILDSYIKANFGKGEEIEVKKQIKGDKKVKWGLTFESQLLVAELMAKGTTLEEIL